MTDFEATQPELTDAQRETFQSLLTMGFDQTKSLNTAQIFGANTEEAINYLLDDNSQINNYNVDADTDNVQVTTPTNDDMLYLVNQNDESGEETSIDESDQRQPIFRINYISQTFACGFFHESLVDPDTIFPEEIQNLMMKYTNLLFIKIKQYQEDNTKNIDETVQYLTIDEDHHDISFRSIALFYDKEKQNVTKTNNTTTEHPDDSIVEYPQFINLWMRLGLIRDLYSLPIHSAIYVNELLDTNVTPNNLSQIDCQRWCELPADLEFTSINELDHKLKDTNKFIEIMIKQNNETKMKKLDHSKIRIGDIIDVYNEDEGGWYESVVTSMDLGHVGLHYIGLCVNANELIIFGSSRIEARGTYSNGPCRRNEWRHSLNVGYKVDIYDVAYRKWYTGVVVKVKTEEGKVKVHYDGYSSRYDEYIERYSDRLQQLNTHTAPDPFWSAFSNYNRTNT